MSTSAPMSSLSNPRSHRNHRHTRSAAIPPPTPVHQNPQNPHHLNSQGRDHNLEISMDQRIQPSTPPRTPRKAEYNSSTNYGSQLSGSESVSRPKSKGKGRPKSVTSTPAVPRSDGSISLSAGVNSVASSSLIRPISTPSAPAYAGATFHASPAPSSLPIPSFYSKSVPDSPSMNGFQGQKGQTSEEEENDSPTPPAAQITIAKPHREESPLDIFFKADREERARASSASSFRGTSFRYGPFSPPSDPSQPNLHTPATGSQGNDRTSHFSGGSTSALFAMELDGSNSPGKPIGPAFSTPYHERISAARPSASLQSSTPPISQEPQSKSEALKAFLFSGQSQNSSISQFDGSSQAHRLSPTHSMPDITSHSVLGPYSECNSPAFISRKKQNSFPHANSPTVSRPPLRGGARSSGLRQEVIQNTTLQQKPEHAVPSNTQTLSPSKDSEHDCSSNICSLHNPPSSSGPITESPFDSTSQNSSTDLKGMEDNLRRILNISPISNADNRGAGITNMPTASISVPNYIGGRPPPMNGLYNGVIGS